MFCKDVLSRRPLLKAQYKQNLIEVRRKKKKDVLWKVKNLIFNHWAEIILKVISFK